MVGSLKFGIVDRYFMRVASINWLAVTLVLLVLMMSHGFARFLGRAAAGKLPQDLVLKLVALSSIEYLVVVVPISILLGIMLALGRHYRDNEMAAVGAAGIGLTRLYRPYFWLILLVTLFTAWLSIDLSPWASSQVDRLRTIGRSQAVDMTPFEAGRFRAVMGGAGVFYTQDMRRNGLYEKVFLRAKVQNDTIIIMADQAEQAIDPVTQENIMVLRDGYRYEGQPGQRDYRITAFREHGVRIEPRIVEASTKPASKPLAELISSDDWDDYVELHWRFSVPMAVILLGLLAVPLAHAKPRQGRYAQLVVALLVYMLYANLLTAGRLWVDETGESPFVGIWSIHLGLLSIILFIIARREGWRIQARRRRV